MYKLLFIVDGYHWALANRANSLARRMSNCGIHIRHFKHLGKINFNDYDIVYSLNWPIHNFIKDKIHKKGDRKYDLITTVCSHIGRPEASRMNYLFCHYDKISCSNNFLYDEFFKEYRERVCYTPFGVESYQFSNQGGQELYRNVFGWVGNSKRAVKRYSDIKSAIDSFGDRVVFKDITASSGLSRDGMADYYSEIGTLICFSKSEGTPNPVLEAASCGRAIISTNVGNVPSINSGNIITVIDKDGLCEAIDKVINKKYNISQNGNLLSKKIRKEWDWGVRISNFYDFFGIREDRVATDKDIGRIKNFWNVDSFDVAAYDRVVANGKNSSAWSEANVKGMIDGDINFKKWNLKDKSVLEYGFGVGRILKYMSEYSNSCHGVDISEKMLKHAKDYLKNKDIKLRCFDGKTLPYDNNSFDMVYSIHVLQHIPTKKMLNNALVEIRRVLKKGGVAALHFSGDISESDKPPGQFSGYRPKKDVAVDMAKKCKFSLLGTKDWSNNAFLLYLGK